MRDMLDNKQTLPNSFTLGNKVHIPNCLKSSHYSYAVVNWSIAILVGFSIFLFNGKVDFYFNKAKI